MSKKAGRRKVRFKPGDVFQISLPDGRYAYGRVYRDASVGIYRQVTNEPHKPPVGSRDFMFNVGMYEDVLTSGQCPIVGHDAFESPEAEWPPPNYVKDVLSGAYRIYHKGQFRRASEAEHLGLEEAAVWELRAITDRIMKVLNGN